MPIYCNACKQFLTVSDSVSVVIELDNYGYQQYVYYHADHAPDVSQAIVSGKSLFDGILKTNKTGPKQLEAPKRQYARRKRKC